MGRIPGDPNGDRSSCQPADHLPRRSNRTDDPGGIPQIHQNHYRLSCRTIFVQSRDRISSCRSATRVSREKSVSFEPDESYYLGEQKEHPDLAIEVNVTSGSPQKLEKYQRLGIQEVWLWQAEKFSIYVLEENTYQALPKSKLLPDLDFELLAQCVLCRRD